MIWLCFIFCCVTAALLAGLESALLVVSRVRARHAANGGDKQAEELILLLNRRKELLQTAVAANHAFSIAAIVLLAAALEQRTGKWSIVVATAIVLPLFLVVLELLPKSFFCRYPFRLLKRLTFLLRILQVTALPWRLLGRLARPLIAVPAEENVTSGGVKALAENIASLQLLPDTATGLLRNFAAFSQITAGSVMKPLTEIAALPADLPLQAAVAIVQQSRQRHHAALDEKGVFIGYLDAAALPPDALADRFVRQFVHPLIRVKTTDTALHCLKALRKAGVPMALVINGGESAAGLLSSRSLVEALLNIRAS